MKRIYYVSRFARRLTDEDIQEIHAASVRNNPSFQITGFLVCLGDSFFQLLEGPAEKVDRLYNKRILPDGRHKDVLCIKVERGVRKRSFPHWSMKVFDLNEQSEALPTAFREMLTALLESYLTTASYTQPSVLRMLEHGLDPGSVVPRRKNVSVLFCDIIGFSRFAEHASARELIDLVNVHVGVCSRWISKFGGEINKLTGDGVLAYFAGRSTDAALEAASGIIHEMEHSRSLAAKSDLRRFLFSGIGISAGLVYEGNIGVALKKDFTILGNKVNLAARLEAMTRNLDVHLAIERAAVRRAERSWPFMSLGKHVVKGQSKPAEIFTLESLAKLDVAAVYTGIENRLKRPKG